MATIRFKAKIQTMFNVDDTVAYQYIAAPVFARSHCDMPAFRTHPKFGAYANSDMFAGMLKRIRSDMLQGHAYLKLGSIPANVSIDDSHFLAEVTLTL